MSATQARYCRRSQFESKLARCVVGKRDTFGKTRSLRSTCFDEQHSSRLKGRRALAASSGFGGNCSLNSTSVAIARVAITQRTRSTANSNNNDKHKQQSICHSQLAASDATARPQAAASKPTPMSVPAPALRRHTSGDKSTRCCFVYFAARCQVTSVLARLATWMLAGFASSALAAEFCQSLRIVRISGRCQRCLVDNVRQLVVLAASLARFARLRFILLYFESFEALSSKYFELC